MADKKFEISTITVEPNAKGVHLDKKKVLFPELKADAEVTAATAAFKKLTADRSINTEILAIKTNGRYNAFIRTQEGLQPLNKVPTISVSEK